MIPSRTIPSGDFLSSTFFYISFITSIKLSLTHLYLSLSTLHCFLIYSLFSITSKSLTLLNSQYLTQISLLYAAISKIVNLGVVSLSLSYQPPCYAPLPLESGPSTAISTLGEPKAGREKTPHCC